MVLLNDVDRQIAPDHAPSGNTTFRHDNVALLGIAGLPAPEVRSSAWFEEKLAATLKRLHLPRNLLQRVSGVRERRAWPEGYRFDDGAVEAGRAAIAEAGIRPGDVGLLINTSVTRKFLEPSVAVRIHHELGLPSSAMNFDIANACLGFLNGMTVAAQMIDSGAVRYALVVASEDADEVHQNTVRRLSADDVTRDQVLQEFATLTLGSGAAAAVLGPADAHPEGHRVLGGIARAGTQHHQLCVGDHDGMFTDAQGLLSGGLELVVDAWREAAPEWNWRDVDLYVTHQISDSHVDALVKDLGVPRRKAPRTYPRWGNVGPASLPLTLADEASRRSPGDRVLCMGVGSGLNTAMIEIVW